MKVEAEFMFSISDTSEPSSESAMAKNIFLVGALECLQEFTRVQNSSPCSQLHTAVKLRSCEHDQLLAMYQLFVTI